MNTVLDNFDLYLRAFGYTVALFLVAGVLSLLMGTFLVACRVSPVGILEAAARMRYFTNRSADDLYIFLVFALGYVILVEIVSGASLLLERRWKVAR